MHNFNDDFIKLSDLEELLNLHPMLFIELLPNNYPSNDNNLFLDALKYYKYNKKDIIQETININKAIDNYTSFDLFLSLKHCYKPAQVKNIVNLLKYLKEYNGYYNKKELFESYDITHEKIDEMILTAESYIPYMENEYPSDHQEFISKFYKNKRKISNKELSLKIKEVKNTFDKFRINKDLIDTNDVKYPVLVAFIKNNKIKSLKKCSKNLDFTISSTKKSIDFDEYSYIYINENIINDVGTEFFLHNKVSNINTSLISNNSIYKSLKQIKLRYKYDDRVDLRVIKKIIDIYDIPLYNLDNGYQLVDRDRFDECLSNYFGK